MKFTKPYSAAGAAILLGLFAACSDQSTEPDRTAHDVPKAAAGVEPTDEANLASTAASVTVLAAGDIAGCTRGYKEEATALVVAAQASEATVLTLGDNVYPDGTPTNYAQCYEPSWGRFKARTRPSPGNHDYHQRGAPGYFGYFGVSAGPAGRGYYSYDLGAWHIVSLNSEVPSAAQDAWLKADLAAHPATCTLAYWHHPFFTSGHHPPSSSGKSLYQILYDYGADVVLWGHNHQYERFAPQSPSGAADPRGIRAFVAGGGGAVLYDFPRVAPNSEARHIGHGVLKMTLADGAYSWMWLPIAGDSYTDAGSAACVGGSAPPPPPPPLPQPPPPPRTPATTNVAPGAYFGSRCSKLACWFTDRSKDADGQIVSWMWTFGDGTLSTSRYPGRTFTRAGTFKVVLTVTDNAGKTGRMLHRVTVAP